MHVNIGAKGLKGLPCHAASLYVFSSVHNTFMSFLLLTANHYPF